MQCEVSESWADARPRTAAGLRQRRTLEAAAEDVGEGAAAVNEEHLFREDLAEGGDGIVKRAKIKMSAGECERYFK
jgi:hypothetical protein